jgi:hypothetical protein
MSKTALTIGFLVMVGITEYNHYKMTRYYSDSMAKYRAESDAIIKKYRSEIYGGR